jgi:two-component system nitrogen regulation sensor histidine kinase NtrY
MSPYKNTYRTGIVLRVIGLALVSLLIVYIAFETWFWLIACWLGLIFILQVIEFIRYAERSRAELISFMTALSQGDITSAYAQSKASKRHNELSQVLDTIKNTLVTLREEKEKNYQYLMTLVEHISIPIVCFTNDYRVQLYNKAAQQVFQKRAFSSLRSFARIDESLAKQIMAIKPNQKALVKFMLNKELLNLSLLSTEFIMGDIWYKIVSFQDIRYELEVKESDSWQKLISVIAHEISNSVIPISALSHTLCDMIDEADPATGNTEMLIQDIGKGLKSIEARSSGLVDFVQTAKKLRQIPDPVFTSLNCRELFDQVSSLIAPVLQKKSISFHFKVNPENLVLLADRKLIEQTLINLLMNAIEATEGQSDPEIRVAGWLSDENRPVISVTDNGTGISPENIEKVFIPHFTTKAHGSGIGLSLARRIMHLHRGNITVHSVPNTHTEMTLRF